MAGTGAALILAAGQGTRMRSRLPKVLHPLAGLPLCAHVVRLAVARGLAPVVVVVSPSNAAAIEAALTPLFAGIDLRFAIQAEPRGTGDAARAGLGALTGSTGEVTILYGDVPLLTAATLERLAASAAPLALLSARVAEPHGYGRICRDAAGRVTGVVEQRDATPAQAAIDEINAGVYRVRAQLLATALAALRPDNAQGELYLTDVVAFAAGQGGAEAVAVAVADVDEIRGVNSRAELAAAAAICRRRQVARHQAAGVTFLDPAHVEVGLDVVLGEDVEVGPGVQLWGRTRVARGARIEGPAVLRDAEVGEGAQVLAFSHLEAAVVGAGCHVGPFARLRPAAHLEAGARVGNFVEVKKSRLGAGAKANHLAYIGDAEVGAGANLGAGTITCNYDGFGKHPTRVGAGAFVGSNSTLVAPLEIGAGAFVAAGSTVTADVPADALAFGRARQVVREGHARRLRERLAAAAKPSAKI